MGGMERVHVLAVSAREPTGTTDTAGRPLRYTNAGHRDKGRWRGRDQLSCFQERAQREDVK